MKNIKELRVRYVNRVHPILIRFDFSHAVTYTFVGILFGLCFPLTAHLLIYLGSQNTIDGAQHSSKLLLLMIYTAPLFLGFFAYIAGQKQDEIEKLNQEVYKELEDTANENVQLEKDLIHANKLSAIGELSAGVGHEINNPLAINSGNIDRLVDRLSELGIQDKAIDTYIEKQQLANLRIKRIVDGLRTYARSDNESVENVSSRVAVDQTVALLGQLFEKEGIQIIKKTPHDDPHFMGSIGKFQQILMNLLTNAKDAMENCEDRKIELSLGAPPLSMYSSL